MDTFEEMVYVDRALAIPDDDVLVVADLHVGRDATSDVELPMGEQTDLLDRLDTLLSAHEPTRLVVAGDFLHAFDSVPYGVHETVDRIQALVASHGVELTVVAGNHDPILEEITSIDTVPRYRLDERTLVHHGHELPEASADRYIIGHEHPAIAIEGDRHPCFLDCPDQHDDSDVLVLPAFSQLAIGTLVNSMTGADTMSPLLSDLDRCRPIVWTRDEPLSFPPLGPLRDHL